MWQIDASLAVWQHGGMAQPEKEPAAPSARIHCRVSPALKQRIEIAARLTGHTLTSFTELALDEKARSVLADHDRIVMSEQAFDAFLGALEAPPEAPSQRLQQAVAAYRDRSWPPT